jgi:6-phosphogluconolactonase
MRIKIYFLLISSIIALMNLNELYAQNSSSKESSTFYIGTYTGGESEGIYSCTLNHKTGKMGSIKLAATSENPSYLAFSNDKRFILAVHETGESNPKRMGFVEMFSVIGDGTLKSLKKVDSGGAHPCYVAARDDNFVISANYTGGNIGLFKIENNELTEVLYIAQHHGSGPNKARQNKPHAHSAMFEPGGNRVFSADLGIDKVKVYEIKNNKLVACKNSEINMVPGAGPRHLAFHPNLKVLYVINELNCSITTIEMKDDGSFNIIETVNTLPVDFEPSFSCADIHLSPDGKFLYGSNRGHNSIAIFGINQSSGKLKIIGHEPTKGKTPRNFTLTPSGDFLLVANQNSNNIISFKRDPETGKLSFKDEIQAPKPVCLVFE